jgi:hypothetical protein
MYCQHHTANEKPSFAFSSGKRRGNRLVDKKQQAYYWNTQNSDCAIGTNRRQPDKIASNKRVVVRSTQQRPEVWRFELKKVEFARLCYSNFYHRHCLLRHIWYRSPSIPLTASQFSTVTAAVTAQTTISSDAAAAPTPARRATTPSHDIHDVAFHVFACCWACGYYADQQRPVRRWWSSKCIVQLCFGNRLSRLPAAHSYQTTQSTASFAPSCATSLATYIFWRTAHAHTAAVSTAFATAFATTAVPTAIAAAFSTTAVTTAYAAADAVLSALCKLRPM